MWMHPHFMPPNIDTRATPPHFPKTNSELNQNNKEIV